MLVCPDSNIGFTKTIIAANGGGFHHNGTHSAFGTFTITRMKEYLGGRGIPVNL